MDTMFFESLSDINYFAVIVATVAHLFFGWIWYSQPLFGKIWMKETGMSSDQAKKGMGKAIIGHLVLTFFAAIVLAFFVGGTDWMFGVKMAALLGAGIAATTCATNHLWEQKSWNLILINAVNQTIGFILMGAILGVWQ